MTLKLEGHDRYYALEQSVLCYFRKDDPGEAVSRLIVTPDRQTAITVIISEGKKARGIAWGKPGEQPDFILKMSFYRAAKKLCALPPWGALTGIRPAKKALELYDQGKEPARELIRRYEVEPERAALAAACAAHTERLRETLAQGEISLYIGIPFCPSRCAYCSFVSADIARQGKLLEPYAEALRGEISDTGRVLSELGLTVKTVYWGGGTPTTLSESQLDMLLSELEHSIGLSCVSEHTVEAGRPDTITREKLAVLRAHGVDRVSVSPQSLDPEVLRAIGREHTPESYFEAFAMAREAGFRSINTDLIAGLPGDTPEGFRNTLEKTLELRPENITVHTLSRKRGSRVTTEEQNAPDEPSVIEMLSSSSQTLAARGYSPYYLYRQKFMTGGLENVGYTLPGHVGKYNILMMEELHTVLALGAGGVTKLVDYKSGHIERFFQCKYPLEYLARCDKIEGNHKALIDFVKKHTLGVK